MFIRFKVGRSTKPLAARLLLMAMALAGSALGLAGCGQGDRIEDGSPRIVEVCGDGIVQPAIGEVCDDGATIELDGCDSSCRLEGRVLPIETAMICDVLGNDMEFPVRFDVGLSADGTPNGYHLVSVAEFEFTSEATHMILGLDGGEFLTLDGLDVDLFVTGTDVDLVELERTEVPLALDLDLDEDDQGDTLSFSTDSRSIRVVHDGSPVIEVGLAYVEIVFVDTPLVPELRLNAAKDDPSSTFSCRLASPQPVASFAMAPP